MNVDDINIHEVDDTKIAPNWVTLVSGDHRPFTMEIWGGVFVVNSTGQYKPPTRLALWMAKGIGMVTKFTW